MNVRYLIHRHPALRRILSPLLVVRRGIIARRAEPAVRAWRRYAELLQSDPIVKVPEFEGVFALAAQSHLTRRIMVDGGYEDGLGQRWVSFADPDRDVIDVGANVGFYTVLAANHLRRGRVWAIEPNASARQRLRENLARNGVESSVSVVPAAASDSAGSAVLYTRPGLDEYSSMTPVLHPAAGSKPPIAVAVDAMTIDGLVAEHSIDVGLVKIDVEGAELRVLNGARRVLAEHRPVILAEVSGRSSESSRAMRLLREHDYDLSYPRYPDVPIDAGVCEEVLCVPRELMGRVRP